MNFFDDATLRLKQQLGVTKDKDAAEHLGLSPVAWAGRKRRGLFPETELYALVAKRPELQLDVAYVLKGERQPRHARMQIDHVAAWAGQQGTELAAQFAKDLIESTATRTASRKDAYLLLVDLADHCDDERFKLLVEVAKALRLASVQASKSAVAATRSA